MTATTGMHYWAHRLAVPFVDALTLLGTFWILPRLSTQFASKSTLNVAVIAMGYLLLCGGVLLARKLEREPRPEPKPGQDTGEGTSEMASGCTVGLSMFYVFFVLAIALDCGGVLETGGEWATMLEQSPLGPALGWVLAIAAIVLLGLFPLSLLYSPKPAVLRSSLWHLPLRLLSVIMINSMVLVTTGFWQMVATGEPLEMALGGKILVFLMMYVVFWLFYAPPRLALMSVEPGSWSLASFAVLLGWTLWQMLF